MPALNCSHLLNRSRVLDKRSYCRANSIERSKAAISCRPLTSSPMSSLLRNWVLLILMTFVFAGPQAQAEYRAFLLKITDARTGVERRVVSTLDELQYREYHHLHPAETLHRLDTWMCWARSDHGRPICPSPRAPAAVPTSPPVDNVSPTQRPETARPTSGDSLPAPPQL